MGEASNEDVVAGRQAEALREDMERTREQIGETLEAIGERLSPGNMAEEAADTVRAAASTTAGKVIDAASERASELAGQARDTVDAVRRGVGDNPVPAAVTAIVLGWVAYKALSGDTAPIRDRRRSMPRRAVSRVGRIVRQNPLAVAVAVTAAGVAVGLAVTGTDTENRILGETRGTTPGGATVAVSRPMER